MAHLRCSTEVAYVGIGINVGSSDERAHEFGLSHFIEHMLFKGTRERTNYQVISLLEDVGGELNAYTTKEETFIYTAFPEKYLDRAVALLADVLFHSTFPSAEMEKEKEVVLDEINSYKDNPAEVIFDEFDELVFKGHPLAHNILGTEETVRAFTREMIFDFIKRNYSLEKMVLFSLGDFSDERLMRAAQSYFSSGSFSGSSPREEVPFNYAVCKKCVKEDTYQAHSILGNAAYSMFDRRRLPLQILCNILGGTAMSARLNYQLRERHGIGYNIETHYSAYTHAGLVYIYWGSDEHNVEKGMNIIVSELNKMIDEGFSEDEMVRVRQQYLGQLTIANAQKEGSFLNFGKSVLHFNAFKTMTEVAERVNVITAKELQEIAKDVFAPESLSSLLLT